MRFLLDATAIDPGPSGARQVIGRGTQSAGCNYQIGPFGRMTKYFDVRRQIVGHGRVVDRLHPQLAQARAKPLAVRIEPLPASELVADGLLHLPVANGVGRLHRG